MERDTSVLSKILLENIGIDFRFGEYLGMRHLLCEVHGYVPNIDDYLWCVSKAIDPYITELIKNGCVYFTFDESVFDGITNKFFDTAMFDVVLVLGPQNYSECSYDIESSGIIDGKKFANFNINISNGNLLDLMAEINRSVSHELMHAYQDLSTIDKSGKRMTDTFNQERYNRMVKMHYSQNNGNIYVQELLSMLYNTEPIEINAFIGEIKADLQSNRGFINGSRKAEEAVKGTDAYKRLMSCWETVEKLRVLEDSENKHRIVKAYNDVFGTSIKSYNRIIKRLTARVEKFSNQVMERASKIAYDIYAEKKPCLIK